MTAQNKAAFEADASCLDALADGLDRVVLDSTSDIGTRVGKTRAQYVLKNSLNSMEGIMGRPSKTILEGRPEVEEYYSHFNEVHPNSMHYPDFLDGTRLLELVQYQFSTRDDKRRVVAVPSTLENTSSNPAHQPQANYAESLMASNYRDEAGRLHTLVEGLLEAVNRETWKNEAFGGNVPSSALPSSTTRDSELVPPNFSAALPKHGVLLCYYLWEEYASSEDGLTYGPAGKQRLTMMGLRRKLQRDLLTSPENTTASRNQMPRFHWTEEFAKFMDILDYMNGIFMFVGYMYGARASDEHAKNGFFEKMDERDEQGILTSEGVFAHGNMGTTEKEAKRGDYEGPVKWTYYYTMASIASELDLLLDRISVEEYSQSESKMPRFHKFEQPTHYLNDARQQDPVDVESRMPPLLQQDVNDSSVLQISDILVKDPTKDTEDMIKYANRAGFSTQHTMLVPGSDSTLVYDHTLTDLAYFVMWREEMLQHAIHRKVALSNDLSDEQTEMLMRKIVAKVNDPVQYKLSKTEDSLRQYDERRHGGWYSTPNRSAALWLMNSEDAPVVNPETRDTIEYEELKREVEYQLVDWNCRHVPVLPDQKIVSFVDFKRNTQGNVVMLTLINVNLIDLSNNTHDGMAYHHVVGASSAQHSCVNWQVALEPDPDLKLWRKTVHVGRKRMTSLGVPLYEVSERSADCRIYGHDPKTHVTLVESLYFTFRSAFDILTSSSLIVCENKTLLMKALDELENELNIEDDMFRRKQFEGYPDRSWSYRLMNPKEDPWNVSNKPPVVLDLRDFCSGYTSGAFPQTPSWAVPVGVETHAAVAEKENLSYLHIAREPRNAHILGEIYDTDEVLAGRAKRPRNSRNVELASRFSPRVGTSYEKDEGEDAEPDDSGEMFGQSKKWQDKWSAVSKDNKNLQECRDDAYVDLTQFVRALYIGSFEKNKMLLVAGERITWRNFVLSSAFDEMKGAKRSLYP